MRGAIKDGLDGVLRRTLGALDSSGPIAPLSLSPSEYAIRDLRRRRFKVKRATFPDLMRARRSIVRTEY